MKNRVYLIVAAAVASALAPMGLLTAQTKPHRDWGRFSGGVESTWGIYAKDKALGIDELEQTHGTNTYVNLGYTIKGFRFGLQYDIFEKPLVGYSSQWEGNGLLGGFAGWSNSAWDITLGTYTEQFGSGLLFRVYEDRDLGLNTSLLGANVHWRPASWLSTKVMAGVPRHFMEYKDSRIYGVDAELSLLELFAPASDALLHIGGSWVLRDDHEKNRSTKSPAAMHGFSGRADFTKGAFSASAEYVTRTKSINHSPDYDMLSARGQALLVNAGLDVPGFGISATWRSLVNMDWNAEDASREKTSLNYLPSLTKQHKYALCSLNPHKLPVFGGETGGQIDAFGEIAVGGDRRRPLRFAVNASMYRELDFDDGKYRLLSMGDKLLFAEAGFELEKKWGSDWKTILLFTWQKLPEFSHLGFGEMMTNTEIVVADVLWQITPKTSLRVEAQHAWSDSRDDQRWAMGLAELGLAPAWMIYVSDMCNYQSYGDNIHYYDAGISYAWKFLRAAASYGRHRAGEVCSGGVCRHVPEYTGCQISLSVIF